MPMKMARLEAAVRVALAYYEAFNRHDPVEMAGLLSESCRLESHDPAPDGGVYEGRAAIAAYWQTVFAAAPGARLEVEEIFGFGYRAVARWRRAWPDESGGVQHLRGVDILRVHDGRITEILSYSKH